MYIPLTMTSSIADTEYIVSCDPRFAWHVYSPPCEVNNEVNWRERDMVDPESSGAPTTMEFLLTNGLPSGPIHWTITFPVTFSTLVIKHLKVKASPADEFPLEFTATVRTIMWG